MLKQNLQKAFDFVLAPAPAGLDGLAPGWVYKHRRLATAVVAAVIVLAYCLLINQYWHFSSDSALYLTLARNLAEGRGYTFNGAPHAKVPGGWPYTLSMLLHVSYSFLWLNVAQTLIALAALAVLYLALREMAGPEGALLPVLITAFSLWVYEYSMALLSEAPFFLCSNLAVLLLLKATRAQHRRGRLVLLVGFSAATILAFVFRVVTAFWLAPFAAALLLDNRRERRLPARAASAAAICLVLFGCFLGYVHWRAARREAAVASMSAGLQQFVAGEEEPAEGAGPTAAEAVKSYGVPVLPEHGIARALKPLVYWPAWALWPPAGVALRLKIRHIAWGLSWIPALLVALGCYRAARRGQILAAFSVLFFAPFLVWPTGANPTVGRYSIAVVPFLILLYLLGFRQLGEIVHDRLRIPGRPGVLVALGAVSLLGPSLLLYGVDAWVQRSPDYYAVFRGGGYAGLMGDLKWLREHDLHGPVAAQKGVALRAIVCIAALPVMTMGEDARPVAPRFEKQACRFAAETGVRYLLTADKYHSYRWPLWHIRRELLGGEPLPEDYWQIWEYDPEADELRRIPVAPLDRWPTRLPRGPKGER